MKFGIMEFLKANNAVRFYDSAPNWKDAIKKSMEPLFEKNVCTEVYYNSIVGSTEKFGPYYILCDEVAMPHGEIGAGVNDNGVAMAIFKEPVYFTKSDKPIYILMPLCAKDASIHTSVALPQIAALFEDPKNIEKIRACKTCEEVCEFISSLDLTKYL